MKLPSLSVLLEESRRTFARFPLVLAVAGVGTTAALILADHQEGPFSLEDLLLRLLMAAAPGLALLTALTVATEHHRASSRIALGAQAAGALLLAGYYATLPAAITAAAELHAIRFALFMIGVHLLSAVLPFTARDDGSAFWEYNKTLFLRVLTTGLYTVVLYAGLSVALLAVENLFGLTIRPERYLQLWILLLGVFNTWLFLAGVPRDLHALASDTTYPKGLKVFTQYVLIPLVLIYLVILYAYTAKIIMDWEWPAGWVAWLVLGFSVTGIFSILLVHPILDHPGNGFIRAFARRYYLALLPMLVLLFLAVWRRISEYGITERRYFVLVLALWLAGIVLYFLLSRRKSIKVIPASLCVLAFGTSFGPWGAFAVSERSQMDRLTGYLTAAGILAGGKAGRAPAEVPVAAAREITSIIRYLDETHGLSSLQPWFDISLDTLGGTLTDRARQPRLRGERARALAGLMGVRYVEEWEATALKFNYYGAPVREGVSIGEFDEMLRLEGFGWSDLRKPLRIRNREWEMRYSSVRRALVFVPAEAPADSVVFDLQAFATALANEQEGRTADEILTPSRMVLDGASGSLRFRLLFSNFECTLEKDTLRFTNARADLLVAETRTP